MDENLEGGGIENAAYRGEKKNRNLCDGVASKGNRKRLIVTPINRRRRTNAKCISAYRIIYMIDISSGDICNQLVAS